MRVAEGTPTSITFDAIPGLKVAGIVSRIKPLGENKQGDMTCVVIVAPEIVELVADRCSSDAQMLLVEGKVWAEGPAREVAKNPEVRQAYLGI